MRAEHLNPHRAGGMGQRLAELARPAEGPSSQNPNTDSQLSVTPANILFLTSAGTACTPQNQKEKETSK